MKGIDPERETAVTTLLGNLRDGTVAGLSESFEDADPLIIGKELAKSLGAVVGSMLMVTSPQGRLTPFGIVPKFRDFQVVGIFDSGFYEFDATWTFTNLDVARRLFDLDDIVTVIEIKLDDIYLAESMAEKVEQAAGADFTTTNWMEQNRSLFNALRLERLVILLFIGLMGFVAALNIFITLTMVVMEKRRDIAVLMAMGARQGQIWSVFTLSGLLVGSLGTWLGLIAGYAISWFLDTYKLIRLPAEIYSLAAVPFRAQAIECVFIAVAALTICFLATLHPSVSAARLNPVEILRYD